MASTTSMEVSLSKLCKIVKDKEAWHAVVHGIPKSLTWLSDWKTKGEAHTWFKEREPPGVSPPTGPWRASWDPWPNLPYPKIPFALWGTLWGLLYPLRSPSALWFPLCPPGTSPPSRAPSTLLAKPSALWDPSSLSGCFLLQVLPLEPSGALLISLVPSSHHGLVHPPTMARSILYGSLQGTPSPSKHPPSTLYSHRSCKHKKEERGDTTGLTRKMSLELWKGEEPVWCSPPTWPQEVSVWPSPDPPHPEVRGTARASSAGLSSGITLPIPRVFSGGMGCESGHTPRLNPTSF